LKPPTFQTRAHKSKRCEIDLDNLRFFNPYADIRYTSNRLQHWQQNGAVYFVTFRLADAIPKSLRDQWSDERATWMRLHPQPWTTEIEQQYHQRFSAAVERWLDAGHGSCVLRKRECAEVMACALRHFDGDRYLQVSWIIMPNHIHCLLVQSDNWPLEKVLHSWKRYTARVINKLLGNNGSFWQRDYFDRLVRDSNHFANCVRYIRNNPRKAGLHLQPSFSYENELARSIE
jgi:REP element-mobilizing transposase RayT